MGVSKQETYLTKVVKEYGLIKEIPCRPPNMESIGDKMFILSEQLLFTRMGVMYPRLQDFQPSRC